MKMNYIKPEFTVIAFGSNQLMVGSIEVGVNGAVDADDLELGSKSNGLWDDSEDE